jgi:hypothetical protein
MKKNVRYSSSVKISRIKLINTDVFEEAEEVRRRIGGWGWGGGGGWGGGDSGAIT